MKTISRAVGSGAFNAPVDVRTVQALLNDAQPALGGADPELVVDGTVGPKTITAIHRFQVAQLGWGDGRVDPGQATMAKLNAPGPVVPARSGVPQQQGAAGTGGGAAPTGGRPGGVLMTPNMGKPAGSFAFVQGDVQVRSAWIDSEGMGHAWAKAMPGMLVFEQQTAKSDNGGRGTLVLDDGTRIELGPEPTVVVIHGRSRTPFGTAVPPAVILNRKEIEAGLRAIGGF